MENKEDQPAEKANELSSEQLKEVEAGEFFTVPQVSRKLGFSRAWITQLVGQGRIKAVRPIGRQWRIPKSEYERLITKGQDWAPKPKPLQQQVLEVEVEEEKVTQPKPGEKKEKSGHFLGLDFSGLFK